MLKKKSNIDNIPSWNKDRYGSAVVQRNFLLLLSLLLIMTLLFGVVYIDEVSKDKTIEPFIVEIEEKTGVPTVVDQISKKQYTADEVIQEYFLYSYIKAREGYDYRTYIHDFFTTVRILSSTGIYRGFLGRVSKRNESSPVNLYGRKIRLEPKIKSIQNINGAKQVRLLVKHINGNKVTKVDHKILYIKYEFVNLEITLEERLVNPLGFRVVDYRVNQDFDKNL